LVRDIRIVNELGMHARVAAKIAKIAQGAKHRVWLAKGGDRADAASVIDLLTLECPQGTAVSVIIEDAQDADILEAIAELAERGFEEESA
jgi:phosphocarrier protein